MTDTFDGKRDFFVSFNQADRGWATWVAWVLEEEGYSVWFQDWDFRGNFVEHMNRAHDQARRTLAVLSDNYFGSDFTLAEWSARFAQDPAAREDRLVPAKVGHFSLAQSTSLVRPNGGAAAWQVCIGSLLLVNEGAAFQRGKTRPLRYLPRLSAGKALPGLGFVPKAGVDRPLDPPKQTLLRLELPAPRQIGVDN